MEEVKDFNNLGYILKKKKKNGCRYEDLKKAIKKLFMFCTRNIQNFLFYFYSIYRISSPSSHVKNVLRYLRPIIFRTTKINYRKTIKPKETKSKRVKERQNIFFQK